MQEKGSKTEVERKWEDRNLRLVSAARSGHLLVVLEMVSEMRENLERPSRPSSEDLNWAARRAFEDGRAYAMRDFQNAIELAIERASGEAP